QRQFWPDGDRIGRGMRKAARGVRAAGKEMEGMAKALPSFCKAVKASRRLVDKSKDTLALALEHRSEVEPLLKDLPEHAQRLADNLPKVGQDLARVLRDTGRLKEMAAGLRKARKGIDSAVKSLPDLRSIFANSAGLLRGMQSQLDKALIHRGDYRKALNQ